MARPASRRAPAGQRFALHSFASTTLAGAHFARNETRATEIIIDRRREYGEERSISIGRIDRAAVIVVAYTERDGRIRLIFARPASRKERQAYHERTR